MVTKDGQKFVLFFQKGYQICCFLRMLPFFCMYLKLLNYFAISVGAQSFCLLTVILHLRPLIDRATRMYKQKINTAGLPDRPLLLLEVTSLLVVVAIVDQKM